MAIIIINTAQFCYYYLNLEFGTYEKILEFDLYIIKNFLYE